MYNSYLGSRKFAALLSKMSIPLLGNLTSRLACKARAKPMPYLYKDNYIVKVALDCMRCASCIDTVAAIQSNSVKGLSEKAKSGNCAANF